MKSTIFPSLSFERCNIFMFMPRKMICSHDQTMKDAIFLHPYFGCCFIPLCKIGKLIHYYVHILKDDTFLWSNPDWYSILMSETWKIHPHLRNLKDSTFPPPKPERFNIQMFEPWKCNPNSEICNTPISKHWETLFAHVRILKYSKYLWTNPEIYYIPMF